ncbi:phage holin family protein [Actinacidiphila yeochonensis]|uniref:phage holin family protein n=1 Tax=Actinacidiphila yeochonensis TaxID=89050 RepID=UPI00068A39F5|nr:phage holin family protein [Actinacidiphila yeochonensis]
MSPASQGDERSLGQLFASATAELSALVHDEIALAKAEIREEARRAAFGSGVLVVALAALFFAVPVGSIAAALGIHALGMSLGWSFCIVFGAYLLIFFVLAGIAWSRFRKVKKPERSLDSAKKTAAVLQRAKPHPRSLESGNEAKALGTSAGTPARTSEM